MGELVGTLGSVVGGALIGGLVADLMEGAVFAGLAALEIGTAGLATPLVVAIGVGVAVGSGALMEASGMNDAIDEGAKSLANAIAPPQIKGKVASGSGNVYVNDRPAARAAQPSDLDTVQCQDHSGPQMVAEGSGNVYINNQPAARVGDKSTCDGTIAEGSDNVFIGGGTQRVREVKSASRLGWLGAALGIALALCGRGKGSWSELKSAVPCLAVNFAAGAFGTWLGSLVKPSAGHPVNVITGGKILDGADDTDFVLPGPLPIEWRRFYSSHDDRADSLFGPGWSVPISVELRLERIDGQLMSVTYWDEQGRDIMFPAVRPGESHYSLPEGMHLICTEGGHYVVESAEGLFRDFGRASGDADVEPLKLRRLEDRNGNWIEVESEVGGDLVRPGRLLDSAGRVLTLVYDAKHPQRVAEIELTRGVDGEQPETLVRYAYSDAGELATVTDRAGHVARRFGYEHGLMTRHTLPGGLRSFYAWSGTGRDARVVRHWTDDGEAYTFDADLDDRMVSITDQLGRVTRWTWNEDRQPTSHTDAEGHVWRMEWNNRRQLLSTTDPAGNTTRFEYDEKGRQTLRIDALGRIERTEWNGFYDLPVAETDPANARWIYRYDDRGNLIKERDPTGAATDYYRDERGLVHTIRDARGGYKYLEWNARAQITAYTDCSGKRTRFAYDARGALARVVNAAGDATEYEADAMGRITLIVQSDGAQQTFRYDGAGRLLQVTDPMQRSTRYEWNARGLLLARVDAAGRVVRFGHDEAFRLASLTNENRETYHFRYDRRDQLIEEIGLDGRARRYEYDARALGVALQDGALRTTFERDAIGRVTAKEVGQARRRYLYDKAGRLAAAELYALTARGPSLANRVNLKYDGRGQVLEEYTPTGWLTHAYDELGNRTTTTISGEQAIDWLHYGSGHVHQVRVDGAVIADFERDDLHREIVRTQGQLTSRFRYDSVGRRTSVATAPHAGADALLAKQWQFDLAGDVLQKHDQRRGTTSYRYDRTGRIELSTAPDIPAEVFRWDAAANLVSSDHPGGYVEHNQLKVFEDKRFEYDEYGRLARKLRGRGTGHEQTFEYDDWHQLKRVVTKDPNGVSISHFEYDALGRRIRKLNGSYTRTDFLWDGMRLAQESFHGRRGPETLTFLYEPDSYVPLARIDRRTPAANDDRGGGSDPVYYFHTDVSGMPEELTDAVGEIVWQARYKVWGNAVEEQWIARPAEPAPAAWSAEAPRAATPVFEPRPQNLRFQGQYLDRETGLHYNTFRFYDPDIGRFIHPDPIGLAGGANLYQYAPNPISWIDPWGLAKFGSGKGTHYANVTVTDASGNVLHTEGLQSGNMTPEEKALGFPRASLATHTEARAVRQIPLEPGQVMTIDGQYPPCKSCQGKMRMAAEQSGATIHYTWEENGSPQKKTWRGSGC
ncbi:type IV secretion protein Rhs [Burkholderia sp. Ac-20379]|nr:RHS repeat-associated core domain-containing protein [Burkholderia sp. Ac-20379]MBN3723569.1 type IV secretion protein Rhs [Burkholderia sp. Ac-20379]